MSAFIVNSRSYAPPSRPLVAICLDGSSDEYLDAALARGGMPNLHRLVLEGYRGLARGAMPSLTNVNNASIATGVAPAFHGIVGNYFWEPATGREVMMNSASFLRASTVFAAAQRAGRKVAVVTAKEKLRDLLGAELVERGGIAFSSEQAAQARRQTHGIEELTRLIGPPPAIYSGEASIYVLRAGVRLLELGRADFLYLSTTDFIQHKYPPEAPEVLDFYAALDAEVGALLSTGAVIGLTADHGMNPKQRADGRPNVVFLEAALDEAFGKGFRVILPITDPYVAHHGALGSFAQVHLPHGNSPPVGALMNFIRGLPGVSEVLERGPAARLMELPPDRMGDLVVCGGRNTTLGRTREWHDLTAVQQGLRSHGGRYEEMVPFIFSEPLNAAYCVKAQCDPRNFDLLDFLCNAFQT